MLIKRQALVSADGELSPKDAVIAVDYFRRAAHAGVWNAAANMGVAYHKGMGVPHNNTLAIHWFERAGDAKSLYLAAVLANHEQWHESRVDAFLARAVAAGSDDASQLVRQRREQQRQQQHASADHVREEL